MKVKILTFNVPDSQGHMFRPHCVDVHSRPMMTRNFKLSDPLGKVDLLKDDDALYAFIYESKFKGLTPAIGFQIITSIDHPNGLKEITEIKLHQIGLCDKTNIDPTIGPI